MGVVAKGNDLAHILELCKSAPAVKAELMQACADEALSIVQLEFRRSQDPNGNSWEPLKYRDGKILVKTAIMRNSFTSQATEHGFQVGNNVPYTNTHNEGYAPRNIPQRQMVPDELTENWIKKLDKAADIVMQRKIKESGGK